MSQKAESRLQRLMPEGHPRYIRCYDNGGVDKGGSIDRYTVVFTGNYAQKTGDTLYLAMNHEPFHPQGFGMHESSKTPVDRPKYGHLGRKIKFADLPPDCQRLVTSDYLDLWDLR